MDKAIVRVASLTLEHIKNVKNGTIVMPSVSKNIKKPTSSDVLGIYGQNGSGKTAIVDAIYFLQQIMTGQPIDPSICDYVDVDELDARIIVEFKIYADGILYEVGYHIALSRTEENIVIDKESLNCAVNQNGFRTNKISFMEYQRTETEPVFKPAKRLDELVGKNKEIKTDLIVARKMAEKSNCSYIFGESSREIFLNNKNEEFRVYSFILSELFMFAVKDLFVIRNTHSGLITANFLLPMAFRVEKERMGVKGDFAVPLREPVVIDAERKELLNEIVREINMVLYTIIPGMLIEVRDYGKQALDSGAEGWRVELMSVREGKKPIPIRMESEGIIKIVSILNALILAFSNPSICLVIDELDAGIFEYMLGELLNIFAKSAKGQLIFTSHNLRALEMLEKESVMFSTANPGNRYIHMKNVKGTNNLRSMYIRSITLGGQDEVIYEETDSLKIAKAFRKAGRSLQNE